MARLSMFTFFYGYNSTCIVNRQYDFSSTMDQFINSLLVHSFCWTIVSSFSFSLFAILKKTPTIMFSISILYQKRVFCKALLIAKVSYCCCMLVPVMVGVLGGVVG